ncbi:MAG TPA: glycogen debranching protein GlgX [Burkholderiaceae bacterium]|nr:glycogen debranching protein GlgX [Burkholderiaceae bacterium]
MTFPMTLGLREGRAWPLGVRIESGGLNIAVFSAHAQSIELCVFDPAGEQEIGRETLPGHTGDVWHGFLEGAGAGLVYGLRAHGPWRPEQGLRFNPHKLLLDPYAREIIGRFEWCDEHFDAERPGSHRRDVRDNARHALKARVVADGQAEASPRPLTPLADTVLYELHVKGFTMRHPGVPPGLRGTYAGLASDAAISHLQRLGITAVSLLPVHQHLDEQRLVARGSSNYWGYNTIGYFAVEPRYASGQGRLSPRDEFRAMVDRLHTAGIEVIIDVVFNHTAESDEAGPTLCWRGLDNTSYYRSEPGHPGRLQNFSGCGNTLDVRHPRVLQMVMDSLRHWMVELHVDGFRFDLAPVLGRSHEGFDTGAPFFHAVAQDPLLAGAKLIAEPWDVGPGGYRLGDFPRGWLEWNDQYRDAMRGYWLGRIPRGEFARRLCASSDLFQTRHRSPMESANFVVAHDGFTLRDLVTYSHKHNEANGEGNRDGHDANHSWNCGVEGATSDPAVHALRSRLQRALLATLLLSQGTPMLAAGAELGQSQGGNNNPYCQDNETTWIDWPHADESLIAFTAALVALRRERLPLGARWYTGHPDVHGLADLMWQDAHGRPLDADNWSSTDERAVGALINAAGKGGPPLLLLANPHADDIAFALPNGRWQALFDSARGSFTPTEARAEGCMEGYVERYRLAARSLVLLALLELRDSLRRAERSA